MAVRDAVNERVEKTVDIPNGKMLLRIKHTFYAGKPYVDVRMMFKDDSGEWKPTKKGIAIPVDIAEEASTAVLNVLPRYSDRKEKEVMEKYLVSSNRLSGDKFSTYSDMLYDTSSEAKKFSPSDSDNWYIYKIKYDSTCYTTKYEKLSFKKILSAKLCYTLVGGLWKRG